MSLPVMLAAKMDERVNCDVIDVFRLTVRQRGLVV